MDELVYNALANYFLVLENTGYVPYSQQQKLLVLTFYRDFVYHDFSGLLTRKDYCLIEDALDCIFGSTCLIPYPDYLKMGQLHLGEMTEFAYRLQKLEDTSVLKLVHDGDDTSVPSDIVIVTADDD